MAAQSRHKTIRDVQDTGSEATGPELRVADEELAPGALASPARAMQADLEAVYTRGQLPVTRLEVYGSVVVFCLATWWAVYLLAMGLV